MNKLDDIQILEEMIQPFAKIPVENKKVTLREIEAGDSEVTIVQLPEGTFVFKLDTYKAPKSIFQGKNDECKRADYAIIDSQHKTVLIIEMKKEKGRWKDIVNQLKGGQCFIDYCQIIGKTFWEKSDFMHGYMTLYISITRTAKRKTKMSFTYPEKTHDTPTSALKISNPSRLHYQKLIYLKPEN